MPVHYCRDGYTFRADAHTLAIMPSPKPITRTRAELEQLGLTFQDDYQLRHTDTNMAKGSVIEAIMNSLTGAMALPGPEGRLDAAEHTEDVVGARSAREGKGAEDGSLSSPASLFDALCFKL